MNNYKPFPKNFTKIKVERTYSSEEYQKISEGEHARSMDEKWNVDFEEPYLFIRRSWTGFCLFKIKIERVDDIYVVVEAFANRNKKEYKETLDERDSMLATIKVDQVAGRDVREQWDKYIKWIMDEDA